MLNVAALESFRRDFNRLHPNLNERTRRLWAAQQAKTLGKGSIAAIARIARVSRTTVYAGLTELKRVPTGARTSGDRIRRAGGGRKPLTNVDPKLLAALEALLEPKAGKASKSLLRWTCKSTQRLAKELKKKGHQACPRTVAKLLRVLGYRLHRGEPHRDRKKQFHHLVRQLQRFRQQGQPVILVETDRRIDQLTAQCVASSVLRWWEDQGCCRFRRAKEMLVIADFNRQRAGAWKLALQRLADDTGLRLTICKQPLGTSRWTTIQTQLIGTWTSGGRGRSRRDHYARIKLVGSTSSKGSGPVSTVPVINRRTSNKVTRASVAGVKQIRHKINRNWSFTISPR